MILAILIAAGLMLTVLVMVDPYTGSGGAVKFGAGPTTVADVRNWSLEETVEAKPYNSSSTSGNTKRLAGNKDWTGSFDVYLEDGSPGPHDIHSDLQAGDFADLDLHVDASNKFEGNALIIGVSVEVDIEGAEIVGATASFEGNGALSRT